MARLGLDTPCRRTEESTRCTEYDVSGLERFTAVLPGSRGLRGSVQVLLPRVDPRPEPHRSSLHLAAMQLTRAISAGLLDSGFASLATFGVGLYAAHTLEPGVLGLYALTFAAFTMASMVSHQGLFVPAEAWAASLRDRPGTAVLPYSLRLAPLPALAAPLVFMLPGLVAPSDASTGVLPLLALTGGVAAVVSPIQDHVRRVLHLSGSSSRAVAVSLTQLASVAAFLTMAHGRFEAAAIPFGVLACANAVSLGVAVILASNVALPPSAHLTPPDPSGPTLRELVGSGRWLLVAQASTEVGGFLAASLLARLGSVEALGFAEAARILGRPVLVLMTGMAAVLGPRLIAAGAAQDLQSARSLRRVFIVSAAGAAAAYALVFGWNHSWNPLAGLVPHAFAIPGLVLATVLASMLRGMALPRRFEAIGAGRESGLARIDASAAGVQTVLSLFAGLLQGFTLAAGIAAFAVARVIGLRALTRGHYARHSSEEAAWNASSSPDREVARAR